MTKYREILRLHSSGISQRGIAETCQCSRNTVAKVLARAGKVKLPWPLPTDMTDSDLSALLFPKTSAPPSNHQLPDLEYVHKEMLKAGVTLRLLWVEYCTTCRLAGNQPLMYSQFCYHYQKYAETKRATMHIPRKPGEQIEVDWAGKTSAIVSNETGETIPVYVFVGVLSHSLYAYVEGFLAQDQECWIAAHVNMFRYFGGATRILVPDNLKTGVEKSDWYSPTINKTYHEMAEHYDTAVVPARVRKPKDKPGVEGTVGNVSTWIIAALRHRKFFTLAELNQAIWELLSEFNSKPFQKKEGSRRSIFLEQEKSFLLPLPKTSFEVATWKIATVQLNYHVTIDKMNYSVPNAYVKHKVDVRVTRQVIEVFYHHQRISSHPRMYGHPGQYSTILEHMPPDHQAYVQWNGERFIQWAGRIGRHTQITVKAILAAHKIEQQAFKSCLGLIKLADKYSVTRLEAACEKALFYTPSPSYKSVKTILATGQDKVDAEQTPSADSESVAAHGFTRGADYYGRIGK
ncbi:MAG: IS21 family transposase [Ruminococcaceae bacterium]|nr:IS21 family transposase [Oscillospiraceae bacterium]